MRTLIDSVSRRRVLQGIAAASFLPLSSPVRAAPLRPGETLPDPSFKLLSAVRPHIVGVRPHRNSGVHLDYDKSNPIESPTGPKYLIHNYGHGGAGITLSWGCAGIVSDKVAALMAQMGRTSPAVAVVGSGVIGLTVATELRWRWPLLPITIYTKDLDLESTTSIRAGGQFEPSGIYQAYAGNKATLSGYLERSRDRIVQLLNSGQAPSYGIAERKDYTLDHEIPALDHYTPTTVVPRYRMGTLPFQRLNSLGREYRTWLLNPRIMLPRLVTELGKNQVAILQRQLNSRQDFGAFQENIIINCTGMGAKALLSDNDLVPQRGHLVSVKKTSLAQDYFFSGGCFARTGGEVVSYVFCRQDDVVIGGSVHGGGSDVLTAADDSIFNRIIKNAEVLFQGNPSRCEST